MTLSEARRLAQAAADRTGMVIRVVHEIGQKDHAIVAGRCQAPGDVTDDIIFPRALQRQREGV